MCSRFDLDVTGAEAFAEWVQHWREVDAAARRAGWRPGWEAALGERRPTGPVLALLT